MTGDLSHIVALSQSGLSHLGQTLHDLFLAPGSSISLASLASALCIAAAVLFVRRLRQGRPVRLAVLRRALLPRWLITGASSRADVIFFLFNTFLAGLLFGWALVSSHQISLWTRTALTSGLGARHATTISAWACSAIMTLVLFLAYELGYWVDHYLNHKIPLLWQFHRVHHTAETLSPLTNFRVHPVDSLIYMNILALFTGAAHGALSYLFGHASQPLLVSGSNVILFVFLFVLIHLQHSHVWIATRGLLGRIILSPAHHQLHHSTNPAHFNKNFGGCLSVWDWAFGTLLIPANTRERLVFGVPAEGEAVHSIVGGMLVPFGRAWSLIGASLPAAPAAPAAKGDAISPAT